MTKEFLYQFIKDHPFAVISYINKDGKPSSAVIGIAVSDQLEFIFDTITSTRKYECLLKNPNVSIVVGWDKEITVQLEGKCNLSKPNEDKALKEIYYSKHDGGRERAATWPGLVHFKIIPQWARYSNFTEPSRIEEISFELKS